MLILADASPNRFFYQSCYRGGWTSCLGLFFSEDRKKVNWRVVGGACLQCRLLWSAKALMDRGLFRMDCRSIRNRLDISVQAAGFCRPFDIVTMNAAFEGRGFVFAFMALPSILFFSALSSLLYYFGILQLVVRGMAWVMSRVMSVGCRELA